MLRWGTLEPFVAFALSMGLAKIREEAAVLLNVFLNWLTDTMGDSLTNDDMINPRYFLKWSREIPPTRIVAPRQKHIPAELSGTDGKLERYSVMPVRSHSQIHWLDASGYQLAVSEIPEDWDTETLQTRDYGLIIRDGEANVVRTF